MTGVNLKDIFFKVFWTAVSAGLAALLAIVTNMATTDTNMAIVVASLTPLINAALAWIRQQTGETPPDLPPSPH